VGGMRHVHARVTRRADRSRDTHPGGERGPRGTAALHNIPARRVPINSITINGYAIIAMPVRAISEREREREVRVALQRL